MSLRDFAVSWVLGQGWNPDPTLDLDLLRDAAPTWGSWQTWRACGTHNVICHDPQQAQRLVSRAFHAVCNLYVPQAVWDTLGQPQGVRVYGGDFPDIVDRAEDIVALHLAAAHSDITLIVGMTLEPNSVREAMVRGRVLQDPVQQWVWVDQELPQNLRDLPNITCDDLPTVLKLLT